MKTVEQKARQFILMVRRFSVPSNITVVVLPGSEQRPKLVGESWHYETKGGQRMNFPSAYKKKGFSNVRYVASTRRIEVGENFGGWAGGFIVVEDKIV